MSEPISAGSVSVDVVPDARGFDEKLQTQLRDITVKIAAKLETAILDEQIAKATRDRDAAIRANLDDKEAQARLDALTRDRDVKIKADSSGLAAAASESQSAAGGLSAMVTAAVLLAPALIPVTAAVGGLVAALSAPLLAAGGGLAVFGIVASQAISQTNKQQSAVNAAAKKVAAAKAALAASDAAAARAQATANAAAQRAAGTKINAATLAASGAFTPGKNAAFNSKVTAAQGSLGNAQAAAAASAANKHAAAQAKLTAAVAAYNAALGKLSPEQQKFESSLASLKGAFTKLIDQAGPVVLGPVIKGMNLLSDVLPKLKPLLASVGGAIDSVLGSIGGAVKGGGFDAFIKGFAALAGPSIKVLASILGNLAVGFGGMLKTFAPLGLAILGALDSITSRFAKFGSGGGFKTFLDYVKKVGPQVAATFAALGKAVGRIVVALAPIGVVVLGALKLLSNVISAIPVDVLTTLGAAIVLAANPIVLIAAAVAALAIGFIYAYKHSETFRNAVNRLGSIIGSNLKPILDAVVKVFRDDLLPTLKKIWPSLETIAKNVGKVVAIYLVLWSAILGKVLPVLITFEGFLVKHLIPPLVWLAKVITDVVVGAFKLFLRAIATVLDGIGHMLVAVGSVPFNPLGGAMKNAGHAMEGAATSARHLADAINGIPTDVGIKVNLALPSNQRLAALANSSHAANTHNQIAGARALGGPVQAGRLYQVNETKMEYFRPASNGTIETHVPLGAGGAGRAGGVTVEINGPVLAHDYSDFMGQMQQRAQRAAVGGRP